MTRRFAHAAALAAVTVLAVPLAACGPNYSPNTYTSNAVQQAAKVDKGVIIGVRPVDVTSSGVVGAATGAAAGGALGAQAPGGSVTTTLGAIGGGLVGGLIGTSVEHTVTETTAYEYIVNKASHELVSVTQQDVTPLAIGVHVLVIAGPQARIVPDYTVDPEQTGKLTPPPSPKPNGAPEGLDSAVAVPASAPASPSGGPAPPLAPFSSAPLAPLPLTPQSGTLISRGAPSGPAGAIIPPPAGATPPAAPPPGSNPAAD